MKTQRIYYLEGLNRTKASPQTCQLRTSPVASCPDAYRSVLEYGIRVDNLFDGRHFRALTEVDNFSQECLAIYTGKSLKGEDVVSVMDTLWVLDKLLPVVFRRITVVCGINA